MEIAQINSRRAGHACFLVHGEHRLQRGVGQILAFQQSQDHSNGNSVVTAESSAFGIYRIAIHDQIQTLGVHIFPATRLLFADHIHVSLQHHRRSGLIAGGSGLPDDNIVQLILPHIEAPVPGKTHQIVADSLCAATAMRDAANFFKPMKNSIRLQSGQYSHGFPSFQILYILCQTVVLCS